MKRVKSQNMKKWSNRLKWGLPETNLKGVEDEAKNMSTAKAPNMHTTLHTVNSPPKTSPEIPLISSSNLFDEINFFLISQLILLSESVDCTPPLFSPPQLNQIFYFLGISTYFIRRNYDQFIWNFNKEETIWIIVNTIIFWKHYSY